MQTAVWLVTTLPRDEEILRFFALIALVLSLTWLVWPKFVLVVSLVWRDTTAAVRAVARSLAAAWAHLRGRHDTEAGSRDAPSSS
jgi:hypothetical protein